MLVAKLNIINNKDGSPEYVLALITNIHQAPIVLTEFEEDNVKCKNIGIGTYSNSVSISIIDSIFPRNSITYKVGNKDQFIFYTSGNRYKFGDIEIVKHTEFYNLNNKVFGKKVSEWLDIESPLRKQVYNDLVKYRKEYDPDPEIFSEILYLTSLLETKSYRNNSINSRALKFISGAANNNITQSMKEVKEEENYETDVEQLDLPDPPVEQVKTTTVKSNSKESLKPKYMYNSFLDSMSVPELSMNHTQKSVAQLSADDVPSLLVTGVLQEYAFNNYNAICSNTGSVVGYRDKTDNGIAVFAKPLRNLHEFNSYMDAFVSNSSKSSTSFSKSDTTILT